MAAADLLDIRDTLVSGRNLRRALIRLSAQFPRLAEIASRIEPCSALIDEINRCLDERGNVRDSASAELARLRREVRIANDRLHDKLRGIIQARQNIPFLQEPVITQREGRYVIPLHHLREPAPWLLGCGRSLRQSRSHGLHPR